MKRIDSINVIPLIDIMLVMLAIVLTTASFINVGKLNVDIPTAKTASSLKSSSPYRIVVDSNGMVFLNDNDISIGGLESAIQSLEKDADITLTVDRNARFGRFTEVVDLLNLHELSQVSIIVRPQQ